MGVEVAYDYDNTPLDEIDRDGVAEETNVPTLKRWADALTMREMEMRTCLFSMDSRDDARIGLGRKLGFVRVAQRWVQWRLRDLGVEDAAAPTTGIARKLTEQVTSLQTTLADRNAKLKAANIELTDLKRQIKAARKLLPTPPETNA